MDIPFQVEPAEGHVDGLRIFLDKDLAKFLVHCLHVAVECHDDETEWPQTTNAHALAVEMARHLD